MAHSSFGTGWPNCQIGNQVAQRHITGRVHRELHELVTLLFEETINRGYQVRRDWSWGYACRAIGGTSRASEHSWGTAVDINAPTNPHRRPLTTDMPSWLPQLWEGYGFRWGGKWSTPDPMHFEFAGSVTDARAQTVRARAAFNGPNPVPTPVKEDIVSSLRTVNLSRVTNDSASWVRGEDVGSVQGLLVARGSAPRNTIRPDGSLDKIGGPGTRDAVKAFQRSARLTDDAIVGENTWKALLRV